MKKFLFCLVCLCMAVAAFADFGPIVPRNTFQIWASKIMSVVNADMLALSKRVDVLELAIPSTTKVIETTGSANFNDPTKDAVLTGTISSNSVIVAKSAKMTGISGTIPVNTTTGNALEMSAGTVEIHSSDMAGTYSLSSNLIKCKNAETMVIDGVTFSGNTYNTIMTGQNCTNLLKSLTIKNCKFNETAKHINVWFAGFQDGAVLNIENCTFKSAEQTLCISDYQGRGVTNNLVVNLTNVSIENYEIDTTAYCGFIICDDRVCTSETQFRETNPFSHITINVKNVTAGSTKLTASNFVMGSGDKTQMLYIYSAKGGGVYKMSDANRGLFPTVNVLE